MDTRLHDDNLGRAGSGKSQDSREGEVEHFIGPITLSSEPGCVCLHQVVPKIRVQMKG